MDELNTHCSFCGHSYPPREPWPRTYEHCGRVSYLNPVPVAVVKDYFNGRRALPGAV